MAVVPGGYPEETALHRRFAKLRTVGEWFEPGDDLLGFIVAEGRTWTDRPGKFVPIDTDLVSMARYVCAQNGESIIDYLSGILRPKVEKDFHKAGEPLRGKTS
jgi:hypothetical protein